MLKQRLITAFILLPIIVLAIWFNGPIPWFTFVVAVCGLLALWEFYRIITASAKAQPLTYLGLVLALLFIIQPNLEWPLFSQVLLNLSVLLPLIWVLFRKNREMAFTNWAWTLAGILYIGWLISHYITLIRLEQGREWVMLALLTTFASDSGAYFVGCALGRHKLSPGISPAKTWEGAAGGVAGAILGGLLLVWLLKLPLNYLQTTLLCTVISIVGQMGDLVESLFKRNMGAKDSSSLLPGHGGFLDRVDSVVFVGIVVYYYAIWIA